MSERKEPLLLLDNSTMYVIGAGDYHSTNLTFEEAKAIIDMYNTEDILRCFTDRATEQVLHDFVGIEPRDFVYKPIRKMRVGQDAIAVSLYMTPSETQPAEVEASDGVVATKDSEHLCVLPVHHPGLLTVKIKHFVGRGAFRRLSFFREPWGKGGCRTGRMLL